MRRTGRSRYERASFRWVPDDDSDDDDETEEEEDGDDEGNDEEGAGDVGEETLGHGAGTPQAQTTT